MDSMISDIVFMVILVAMSGFFSATETAFSSFNKTKIKALAENGSRTAKIALQLSARYDKLISTILIGNNIVNIAVASVATVFFIDIYGSKGATYATIIITIVVLIFGEISPKSIAKDCPEKFTLFAAPIMKWLVWLLAPANFIFSLWKKGLAKVLRINNDSKMSQAELLMLVEEVQQEGSIDNREGELLKNVIEFTDQKAEDILTPRVKIEALPSNATKEEIARKFSESQFSRLLIYEDNVDNIIGVIHLKDLFQGSKLTEQPLEKIMTPPLFVMQSAKISELLKQLQSSKSHIAIVLDEYGGTYGIVTMEDILEELVGDIWDEHDDVIETIKELGKDTFEADGSLSLSDFTDRFKLRLDSESSSLNGWIIEQLGSLPQPGNHFDFQNFTFTVESVENRCVQRVTIKRHPETKSED